MLEISAKKFEKLCLWAEYFTFLNCKIYNKVRSREEKRFQSTSNANAMVENRVFRKMGKERR
jgi:hypothetical protein